MVFDGGQWFNVEEINDGVWAIRDITSANSYLIEGKTKSLLVDTGWGIGDLAELVHSLTKLPVEVVFTHGHPDHVNGAYQFSDLYITFEDENLLYSHYVKETREQIINRFKDILPANFSMNDWVNAEITSPSLISEGDTFDLGGKKLKVIECPGHTPGSICLLDKTDQILFSGDSLLSKPVLMNLETSLKLSTYLNSIMHVNSFSDDFKTILSGHDEKAVDPVVVKELIDGVSDIIGGKTRGKVKKTRFGEALVSKFEHTSINYNENSF